MNKTIIALVIVLIVVLGVGLYLIQSRANSPRINQTLMGKTEIPFGKFVKVSNQDYAPLGKVEIFEQSWIGCPVGAVASWAIFIIISHYGNVTYYTHYSDPYDKVAPNVPGIIFEGFKPNSSLLFDVVYTYNEYLNATPNGVPIPESQLVQVGEQELVQQLPPNISSLIIKYETQVPVQGYNNASVYIVSPPHLNFALVVTGPNGTYILTTPLISPKALEGYNVSYVMSHMYNITALVQGAQYLQEVINEAFGSSTPVVNCVS
ncbi:MAG: DUF929 domain-containing protein [Candidatus Aramenus sp.]|nr:DUF929 domain-containing protein [Candidatus Aramenus sp.]